AGHEGGRPCQCPPTQGRLPALQEIAARGVVRDLENEAIRRSEREEDRRRRVSDQGWVEVPEAVASQIDRCGEQDHGGAPSQTGERDSLEQQAPTVPALPGRPPARRDLAAGFGEGCRVSRLGLRSTSVYGRHG